MVSEQLRPEEEPMIGFIHQQEPSVELLVDIPHLWEGVARNVFGNPIAREELVSNAQRQIDRCQDKQVTLVAPLNARDKSRGQALSFNVALGPALGVMISGWRDGDVEAYLDIEVFQRQKFNYATMMGGGRFDPESVEDSDVLAHAVHLVARRLNADFVFGDVTVEFAEPGLIDPRSRAWSVAYYGMDLVRRIGEDRFRTLEGAAVTRDAQRGGYWVRLSPTPFTRWPGADAARACVAEHLRLSETFPNEP